VKIFKALAVLILLNVVWLTFYTFQPFGGKRLNYVRKSEVTCGRWPQEQDITIDNIIWQVLSIPKGFYKLMNAYLDTRENKTIVRVSLIGDFLKQNNRCGLLSVLV
jgi:hypothetical protein